MSWLGKFIGGAFGLVMGGPLGLALGAALGHQLDRNGIDLGLEGTGDTQRLQMAFFGAAFQVMGHIAKADGRVSEAEIEAARTIMQRMMLPQSLRETAMRLYNDGKREGFPFNDVVDQFHAECHRRAYLLRMFIALQTEAALADGSLHPAKEQLLLKLCDRLHFSRYEYIGIRTRLEAERRLAGFGAGHTYRQRQRFEPHRPRETPLTEAYATLGQTAAATDEDIKRAYRRLISQHHPDKLAAQGVSRERMQKATEQTQNIQKAYEAICKVRKL
jgi:DnaJ like chaperone protein